MYKEIYELCHNVEKVMGMFSKELLELDRNTEEYMIDEMQKEIDEKMKKIIMEFESKYGSLKE